MPAVQLTKADRKFWSPDPRVLAWVSARIPVGAKVLEIGPGTKPFPRASHFVDWAPHKSIPAEALTRCDLQREPLPFADKSWDFVYCRHVLEDLYDPFHLCDEMSRIAKAGYLEVPSPLAEICRGIDGGAPAWRGYHHHRYIVWSAEGVLNFLTKYPMIEHLEFPNEEGALRILRANRTAWNASLLWRGRIDWRFRQHGADYIIARDYRQLITAAINEGLAQARSFGRNFAIPAIKLTHA
jgi:hypothetical protein